MKKYGFFGGCFNPVTKAHVELALEIINKYKLDKVIFVPMGDGYNKKGLINEKHRYNMLQIATKQYEKLEVSNIELESSKSISTLEAFKMIEFKYGKLDKYYIIGIDNLFKIMLSKDFEELVQNYNYIIIQRNGINAEELITSNKTLQKNRNNFKIVENPSHMTTSSSIVRDSLLKSYKEIERIMQKEVLEYIEKNGLYKL